LKKKTLNVLLVCALIFIWGNSLMPRDISGWISDTVMEYMNRGAARAGLGEDTFTYMYDQDGDGEKEPTSHIVRKMAHVTEFAVFAALLWLRLESHGRRRALTALIGAAAVGGVDELLQLLVGRGSMLSDVLIDTAGAAGGIALTVLLTGIHRRQNRKKQL